MWILENLTSVEKEIFQSHSLKKQVFWKLNLGDI